MKDNKVLRILLDIILIILGIIFLVFGIRDLKDKIDASRVEDNVKFKKDYSYVSKDNIYKYTDLKEISKMLDNGVYVILVGNQKDSWTQILVSPLNDTVKSNKIKTIYYLDTQSINTSDKNYSNVLSKLKIDDFKVPSIIFIKNNKINIVNKDDIYDKDYKDAPIEYWTEEKLEDFNELITKNINKNQE